jgi:hypothetical protein
MMSHKDFVLIAAALASARNALNNTSDTYCALDAVVEELADALARTNPRFDRARFLAAARGEPLTGRDKVKG